LLLPAVLSRIGAGTANWALPKVGGPPVRCINLVAFVIVEELGYPGNCFPEGPMKVSDLIGSRKEVYFISEEKSVMEAAQYLREKQVRSVGVVDAEGKLTGVISQSDISDKVAAENKYPESMKVSEIMSRELLTVTPEMTFEDSLRAMEQNGVYHLLILDAQNRYQGMLSVSDLLKVMAADNKERADMLESYIFPQR
jgi:CBS domain-containing protein